jgi:tRNA-uridine 2-sulfurtransferase
MKDTKRKKVFAMLSGGVDSSVGAALLKKQGFAVTGVFMKNWGSQVGECSWMQDEQDARRVAAKLDIPFYVLNFEEEYKERVFAPFLADIKKGITPNPDVCCNEYIKFGAFMERALKLGADMVSTGHYARLRREFPTKTKTKIPRLKKAIYKLLKAKDQDKDQTYFLHRLNQLQLSKTLFPIGGYIKADVRIMAKELGLPTYNKPDSQGICFVGEKPFEEFLSRFLSQKSGNIIDRKGNIIGSHKGVQFYTIGQRKGLGIGGLANPLFVAQKDARRNTLTVVKESDKLLYSKYASVRDFHWVAGEAPAISFTCKVRFRHQQPLQAGKVSIQGKGKANVEFSLKQRALTPGQAIVLYQGKTVLGGGVIGYRE